jgi:hypothetical protein
MSLVVASGSIKLKEQGRATQLLFRVDEVRWSDNTLNVSSRTCTPPEGRGGIELQLAVAMTFSCAQDVTATFVVIHEHRRVPLSSACGERVRNDTAFNKPTTQLPRISAPRRRNIRPSAAGNFPDT